jgi:hypothetical protein
MENLWINLNHPYYTVDLTEARNEEDERVLWGQGYVPLGALREVNNDLWVSMAKRFDIDVPNWDFNSIELDDDNPHYTVLPSAGDTRDG